jgi:transcriptional regulator with XRE-family HTH domain
VPGLRREEVAVLAGVSIDYYTRLERGNLAGVSDSVLEAVARALRLDEAERAHLLDLARTANNTSTTRRRRPSEHKVRPGMQRLLDAMTAAPTLVRNGRLDVIATNPLGRALLSPAFVDPATPTNLARFTFIDPAGREFFVDWDDVANATVAILRTEAGRDPADRNLTDLIGELATRSDEFRTPLGRPQRPPPRPRCETLPPPRRRRHCPDLRGASTPRRPRTDDDRLHRRTRLRITRRAGSPRQLGRNARPRDPTRASSPAQRPSAVAAAPSFTCPLHRAGAPA